MSVQLNKMNQNTPIVACLRCRKQKLRCTREQPACRRCQRVRAECKYPPAPDRRQLALQRVRDKSSTTSQEHQRFVRHDANDVSSAIINSSSTDPGRHHGAALRLEEGGLSPKDNAHATIVQASCIPPSNDTRRSWVDDVIEPASVSKEVALFLIEIFFERHYQANLLFHRARFIEDYLGLRMPRFISLAVFAFGSLFLKPACVGTLQGQIDISEVSSADWRSIGETWAERASMEALMHADRPRVENIQACQVLALFWFAKSQTSRTNMHSAIAYRTSFLLHLDKSNLDWPGEGCYEREQESRCFWACWLTKCASHQNAYFQRNCWADVAGYPLPRDSVELRALDSDYCLNETGSIRDLVGRVNGSGRRVKLNFLSALVLVQGLWWEVQQFVQSFWQNAIPSDWATKFCSLDERLQLVKDSMEDSIDYDIRNTDTGADSASSGRIFSLNYLYHLCLIYLHSALVPVLSCNAQTPILSKNMLRLAAERALEHSSFMTNMTDHFLSHKRTISKLWPVVGYGAYVCAAIQLRYFVANSKLDKRRLERSKVHLRVADELKDYWLTLRPLHADMCRQFSRAQTMISSQSDNQRRTESDFDSDVSCLSDQRNARLSPMLSSGTYLRDGIRSNIKDQTTQIDLDKSSNTDISRFAEPVDSLRREESNSTQSPTFSTVTGHSPAMFDPIMSDDIGAFLGSTTRQDNDWWDQTMENIEGVFENGVLLIGEADLQVPMY